MFNIGDKVIYKKTGVCSIIEIANQDFGNGTQQYYVISPFYASTSSRIMIPVLKSDSLRTVMNKDDALKIIDNMPQAEDIWVSDSKIRKEKFLNIINGNSLDDLCSLIKTIYYKKEDFLKNKKMISMMDKDIFETAEKLLYEELAASLDISIDKLMEFIDLRIGKEN